MTNLILIFLAAAIPIALYLTLAWSFDRHEKEPLWLLAAMFGWGAVPAIVISIIAEFVLQAPLLETLDANQLFFVSATFIAPPVEEFAKAIPLLALFLLYRREFDGLGDGLLYGAVVGFGFAMTENVFYFLMGQAKGGAAALAVIFFLRSVVFGFNHALYSSMFGLGLGVSRNSRTAAVRWGGPLAGLAAAILFHMAHNFLASIGTESNLLAGSSLLLLAASFLIYSFGCLVWVILFFSAGYEESRWIREELKEEIEHGVISPEHAYGAHHYRTRLRARSRALAEKGHGRYYKLGRLYGLAAELSLKKRQHRLHPEEDHQAEIEELRGKLRQLNAELAE